jgi:hypothetical protein
MLAPSSLVVVPSGRSARESGADSGHILATRERAARGGRRRVGRARFYTRETYTLFIHIMVFDTIYEWVTVRSRVLLVVVLVSRDAFPVRWAVLGHVLG